MLEGSQLPNSLAAEQRMDHLLDKITGRLDSIESQNSNIGSAIPSIPDANGVEQNPKSFKAMVSIMQAQMMGEAFNNDNDDKNSSNPFMMQAAMMGAQGQSNPMMNQMQAQMMMQSMMSGGQTNPMMGNPMMSMMGMQNNPMMTRAFMNPMMGGQANLYAQNFFAQAQGTPMANFLKDISNTSNMVMPVKGEVSSEYGHRHHPISGHHHFHSGVDIAAQKGTVIRSPWEGRVVHVGYVQGFGNNTVIVAHENQIQPNGKIIYSVFGHNDKALVHKGEYIKSGEIFATVGSEGNSTGPHLHWETRIAPPGVEGTDIFKKEISHTVDPMTFA